MKGARGTDGHHDLLKIADSLQGLRLPPKKKKGRPQGNGNQKPTSPRVLGQNELDRIIEERRDWLLEGLPAASSSPEGSDPKGEPPIAWEPFREIFGATEEDVMNAGLLRAERLQRRYPSADGQQATVEALLIAGRKAQNGHLRLLDHPFPFFFRTIHLLMRREAEQVYLPHRMDVSTPDSQARLGDNNNDEPLEFTETNDEADDDPEVRLRDRLLMAIAIKDLTPAVRLVAEAFFFEGVTENSALAAKLDITDEAARQRKCRMWKAFEKSYCTLSDLNPDLTR